MNSLPIFHWKPNSFCQPFGFSRAAEFFALCQGPKVPVFCFDWVHIHLLLRSNKQIMKFVPFGGNLKYLTDSCRASTQRQALGPRNKCSRSPSIWVSGHWGTEPGGHRARHGWQCVFGFSRCSINVEWVANPELIILDEIPYATWNLRWK